MSALNFFYSYCHSDKEYREKLETHLSMLVKNSVIKQWHDGKITAGSPWATEILDNLEKADIVVFLITANWLNSTACTEEWEQAIAFSREQPHKRLIPVIAEDCAWQDFDSMPTKLVLPTDGKPVSNWDRESTAWSNVYDGIKNAANEVKKNFMIKPSFEEELKKIEFCSALDQEIPLDSIFVFPNLSFYIEGEDDAEYIIESPDKFNTYKKQFIIGDSQSGKTKLCSWMYLDLSDKRTPCLYIDLSDIGKSKDHKAALKKQYEKQKTGSFEIWLKQKHKHVFFDNLTKDKNCIELIKYSEDIFDNIYICSNSDLYRSFYIDDERFTNYKEIYIKPFCHGKQEELIKKWLSVKGTDLDTNHQLIDSIENNINSIIIDNKVLPRYPFFILSILQTYESFMPENLKITAYGHCYHALILARLIRSGINQEDSALGAAFTFCSNLAYEIYKEGKNLTIDEIKFNNFRDDYSKDYIIKNSVFSRLFSEYGLLQKEDGRIKFSISYSYYFFLGKYLTESHIDNKEIISQMIESSYARHNSLTLIFTIHHANDISIIDEILTYTICAIDNKKPAKLTKEETSIFNDLLSNLVPENIKAAEETEVVENERKKERFIRTKNEEINDQSDEEIETLASQSELLNQVFQCNKNIEILSQILKNKTGSLRKSNILEIVEIICDAGLRLASVMLGDHRELELLTRYVHQQYKESDEYDSTKSESFHLYHIRQSINFKVMLWVLNSIEKSVKAINKPELRDIVINLVSQKDTPAYHLIKYFYLLDTSENFDDKLKKELEFMTKKYTKDNSLFINRTISIRTLHYEKTHKVKEQYRQSIFSNLGIKYKKPDVKSKDLVN